MVRIGSCYDFTSATGLRPPEGILLNTVSSTVAGLTASTCT